MIRGEELPPEEKEQIMALTRKALKAMGLTEEQVDSIIEAHTETVDGLKEQLKTYRADAERLESVQRELDALKGGEDYKAKYEAEKTAHEKTKSEHAAKETAAMRERLFRAELTAVGITGKRADKIIGMTDLSAFEVRDGAYADAKTVQEAIRSEWSDFIPSTSTQGAQVATPPKNVGGRYSSRAEIMAIKDTAARQKAISENLDLFNR